jgi:serine/threonine-protein kinase
MPFFSHDGRWIGFRMPLKGQADHGEFRKVPLDGGQVQFLASTAPYGTGATWGEDDVIVFGGAGLKKMPAAGGEPSPLTTLNKQTGEMGHHHPHALPDRRGWLYTVVHGAFADDVSVWVLSAKTGTSHLLIKDAADARYAETGHIVFARDGRLLAVPFDLDGLRVTGGEVIIFDSVLQSLNGGQNAHRFGTAHYAFSGGNLVYVTGGTHRDGINGLGWLDLASKQVQPVPVPKMPFAHPRLSPDQRHIAATTRGADETAVWVYNLDRGEKVKVQFDGYARLPLWTGDGERIVFTGEGKFTGDGKHLPFGLYSAPADGSAPATPLTRSAGGVAACWDADWNLIFVRPSATVGWADTDIMLLNVKDGTVTPLLATPGVHEYDPTLSPDGRWLAYTSNESSKSERTEVFVRPYPALGTKKFTVSTRGGRALRWVLNGKALLYKEGESGVARVMKVDVTEFSAGSPQVVWEGPAGGSMDLGFPIPRLDATRDGRRLLVVQPENPTPRPPTHINLVQDWLGELLAKMRAGR